MNKEIELLLQQCKAEGDEAIIKDFIPEIEALLAKFNESGQSGASAPYTAHCIANTVRKLCLKEPLTPITGGYWEWIDVTEAMGNGADGKKVYQNSRCGGLFMASYPDGKSDCYYIDAIIWKDGECCWNGLAKATAMDGTSDLLPYFSRQQVKSFPFTPKTFHICCVRDAEDDLIVIDEKQLAEALAYYDR